MTVESIRESYRQQNLPAIPDYTNPHHLDLLVASAVETGDHKHYLLTYENGNTRKVQRASRFSAMWGGQPAFAAIPNIDWHLAVGTHTHQLIEHYFSEGFYVEGPPRAHREVEAESHRCYDLFLDWFSECGLYFVDSEKHIWNHALGVCGRFDLLFAKQGDIVMVDAKTTTHIGQAYYLQQAIYAACLQSAGINVAKSILLSLPKTGTGDKAVEHVVFDTPERKAELLAIVAAMAFVRDKL